MSWMELTAPKHDWYTEVRKKGVVHRGENEGGERVLEDASRH